jgi:hypothetical protein
MEILGEQVEPLFEEGDELRGHLVQLGDVTIRRYVAEASADRIVDEQQVCKLIPAAFIQLQLVALSHAIRANLHQNTVLRTAAGAAIQPYDQSLAIGKVAVLEEPEEEVSVVFGGDFNVTRRRNVSTVQSRRQCVASYPACIFSKGTPSGAPGRECTK